MMLFLVMDVIVKEDLFTRDVLGLRAYIPQFQYNHENRPFLRMEILNFVLEGLL